ncbi:hypothetical protein [Nostoc sp. DSM 114167]|uniref:hypothetical protein n=1 Tax=Nostoc sp. DSM 114167 TaxID=3439050 RepID=UPI004045FF9D
MSKRVDGDRYLQYSSDRPLITSFFQVIQISKKIRRSANGQRYRYWRHYHE